MEQKEELMVLEVDTEAEPDVLTVPLALQQDEVDAETLAVDANEDG